MIAAGLFRIGDEKGPDFLVEAYKMTLVDHPGGRLSDGMPRHLLEGMYHSELIKRIKALKDDPELQERTTQRNIDSLLQTMGVNGMTLEELREQAQDQRPHFAKYRMQALAALSEVGLPEDVALLEGISDQLAASPNATMVQKNKALRAAVAIRCRLWKKLK